MKMHPDCGGPDNACLVAEGRGVHNRCSDGECAYADSPPAPLSILVLVPAPIFQGALNYIRHIGANWTERGEPHQQQWIVDGLELAAANQPGCGVSSPVPERAKPADLENLLYAVSDEFHRMEINGYHITERGDAAWRKLSEFLTDKSIERIERKDAAPQEERAGVAATNKTPEVGVAETPAAAAQCECIGEVCIQARNCRKKPATPNTGDLVKRLRYGAAQCEPRGDSTMLMSVGRAMREAADALEGK